MYFFDKVKRIQVFYLVLLIIVVNLSELVGVSLFIPIIDLFQGGGKKVTSITSYISDIVIFVGVPATLPVFLAVLCVIFLLKTLMTMLMRYESARIGANLQHNVRYSLFESFMDSDVAFIYGQHQGSLQAVLGEFVLQVGQFFFLFIQFVSTWVLALVYVIFVCLVSWKLSLVAFLLGLSLIPVVRWVGDKAYHYGKSMAAAVEATQHCALETLQAKKLINAMNWRGAVKRRYHEYSIGVRDAYQWMAFWSNSPAIILQPVSVIILSILILLSINLHLSTALLGGFVLAFLRLLSTIQAAVGIGGGLKSCRPSINRVSSMLELSSQHREKSGKLHFGGLRSSIALESVCFGYGREASPVLEDASLVIKRGETVALVGASGSGKTTLADLIVGVLRPSSGVVLVDGIDLNKLNLSEYREKIAYVPQDPMVFHDSIRNNLVFGLGRAIPDTELRQVCESVGAWQFISERTGGLDAVLGDRGVQLSGGQRQRLAMARAFLRKPELLILDEATSALDHTSEIWIQRALEDLQKRGDITILIIAHRFTTIKQANRIYLVTEGKVKNLGSWDDAKSTIASSAKDMGLT